jgi:hypothetical protein
VFRVDSRKFSCYLYRLQSLYTTFCFLPPIQLMLTLTPRVLGTSSSVLLLQVLCRMKKLLSGVKRVLLSCPSSQGSCSSSGDNESQDSPRSSSFVPSPHGTTGSSRYLEHDDVPAATDGDCHTPVLKSTEPKPLYVCPGCLITRIATI